MRIKATRGILAAAMVASTAVAVGVGSTSPASAATCSTWQYEVTAKTGVYADADGDGDVERVSTAWATYLLNVPDPGDYSVLLDTGGFSGWMKLGNLYTADKDPLSKNVLLRKDMLDYVTCW